MKPIALFRATLSLVALVAIGVSAASDDAQAVLDSYISAHPISTRVASKSSVDLASVKASILAGNYTPSRPWALSRELCPGSCTSLGINASSWPVYTSIDRLSMCDGTMLLSFSLYNQLDESGGTISIRSCAADLDNVSATDSDDSCAVPVNSTSVTASLKLAHDTSSGTGSSNDAVDALTQLLAYENMNLTPCNESINFAYSGQTAVGLYVGSGLHSQGVLPSILEDLIKYIEDGDIAETLFVQLCTDRSARYSMGIMIDSTGEGLPAAQAAVREWRNDSCLTSHDTISWKNLTYSVPVQPHRKSNSTGFFSYYQRRAMGRTLLPRDTTCTAVQVVANDTCTTVAAECGITLDELETYNPSTCSSPLTVGQYICCTDGSLPDYAPSPDADGDCYSYTVQEGDTCSALAATYTITVDDIESYNNDTWGWMGCDDLLANENICLSSGWPPMPATISNAVCGPQVNGTVSVPHGTDLSTLNECPLNACCDIWGQCGITADFCTATNSTTGAPGTAANGTNGCISNCGTEIISSDEPAKFFKIGYFEGFDVERVCMRTLITEIDTSAYTHIHMSFATLNSDFTFNISTVESQMDSFAALTDVKRIITVGGWDFSTDVSTYDIFREAFSVSDNRDTLVTNTIAFLKEWDLDGVDWDWEYPGEPDIPGIPADTDTDAEDFFLFLLQLEEAMASEVPNKTISTTAPSSFWYMKAIPIEAIGEVVDYIVIMTYDMHGQWDWNNTYADTGCPEGGCLRSHVNLTETLSALSMITKAGVSSNQVAVGVASYARSFQMTEAGCYAPNCTFTGPESGAYPGPCTDTAGYISNAELFVVAEEWDVYSYLDEDSDSNIMVWNETQWAAYMDEDVKASRLRLYESMSFLGTADWAIDLLTNNDSTTGASACLIYIDPSIWDEAEPTVTAIPGCTLIWPPQPLNSSSVIIFPPWTTGFPYSTVETKTTSTSSGADVTTVTSHVSYWFPTVLPIAPITTDAIPLWEVILPNSTTGGTVWLTSSVQPEPFTVVWTPTIGGTTIVISATTTATSAEAIYTWGNEYTFTEPAMTDTLGGSTTVVSGTTLTPVTTTVTPDVYPTTVASTHDHKINTKKTHWKSGKPPSPTASPGCAGCGKPCFFCDPDCPTCNTNADSNDSGNNNNDSSSKKKTKTQTSTSCATTTTTSNCDLWCTVTTSASVATTSCTSTVCYTVTGCDVTATTETLTSVATAAACPTITDGALLQLNGDTFNGCQPCSWHFVPFYDPDDATDTVEWPILAQSSFFYPDVDLKRREMNTQIADEVWDESTAIPAATVTATQDSMMTGHPMITSAPKSGSKYGNHVNVLQKRATKSEISTLAKCPLPSSITIPSYTAGVDWYTAELKNEVPDDQTDMPRWYHTTVENCQPSVTVADQAVLQAAVTAAYNAASAAAVADGKDGSTVKMTEFDATMDHAWEVGWLKDFFDRQFRPATTNKDGTVDVGLSCDVMEQIFFTCDNELQTIYNCLASDTHFEFAGMNKVTNSWKAKISKDEWSGTYRKNVERRAMLLKKNDKWSSDLDNKKNQQNWGAAKKFSTLKDFVWAMIASCDVVTDAALVAVMDKTNSRLYNAFTALDAKIAGTSTWAADFKTFMEKRTTITETTNDILKKMVKVMEAQKPLLLAIAAKTQVPTGENTSKTMLDDANTLIAAYDSLVAKYGLTQADGVSICTNPLVFTWDTTVQKRDTVSSASACTISLTATASATTSALCYAAADPDSGNGGTWCECSGSSEEFPTLAGSDICGYTAIPTYLITSASNPYPYTFTDSLGDKIGCASETVKVSDGTSVTACAGASTTLSIDYSNNPYPYTFTDFYGDVVACESETIFDVDTYTLTECAGSRTTEHYATITVTDVVTTSALSKLCEGGSYWQCITDYELQKAADCGPIPKEHMECVGQVIEDAQDACMTRCVFTTSTYTTVYATRAP